MTINCKEVIINNLANDKEEDYGESTVVFR